MLKRWFSVVGVLLIAAALVTSVYAGVGFRFTASGGSWGIVGSASGLGGNLGVDELQIDAVLTGDVLCGLHGDSVTATFTISHSQHVTSNGNTDFNVQRTTAQLLSLAGPVCGGSNGTGFIHDEMNLTLSVLNAGSVVASESFSCVADNTQTPAPYNC